MIIKLNPYPAPRPRFSKFGTYNTSEYTKYKKDFLREASKHNLVYMDKAIRLEIIFFMPIPKSMSKKKQNELDGKYHTKKPDIDNLTKTVLDSLEGVCFKNDSQICEVKAKKIYSFNPRVQFVIYSI